MSRARVFSVAVITLALAMTTGGRTQPARVQIGYCTSFKNIEAAKAAGFDYVEVGTSEIAALSDAEFEAAVIAVKQVGLPVPAANLFLPATLKVTGPDIDPAGQLVYVRKALDRLSRLGVQVVVFGSGGARRVPDGFPQAQAFQQLVEFGKRIGPEARARGITITIEPLRSQESNIITTAAEGLRLVEAIDDPNFQLMIDFFHLASEKEDPVIVTRAGTHLRHLHMANPTGRVFPLDWGEYDYAPFFARLRGAGYSRRMSVEATPQALATDAPRAIALLRRAFSGTGLVADHVGAAMRGLAARVDRAGTVVARLHEAMVARLEAAPAAQAPSVGPRPNVGPADRPVVDPVAVERGARLWAADCITCHGASARGSDTVRSLLRSDIVLRDRRGTELGPFLAKGHPTQSGRPSVGIPQNEVVDLTQFLRQKINDTLRGSPVFDVQNILVGNAQAGAAYFSGPGKCTACHSTTGDLAGIASRITAPVDLQQRMLFPPTRRTVGFGRGAAAGPNRTAVTVTITPRDGTAVSGTFVDEDDFYVTYRDAAGFLKVLRRTPGMQVVKDDPLRAHREWLDAVTDTNIHDLTAFLVTLK